MANRALAYLALAFSLASINGLMLGVGLGVLNLGSELAALVIIASNLGFALIVLGLWLLQKRAVPLWLRRWLHRDDYDRWQVLRRSTQAMLAPADMPILYRSLLQTLVKLMGREGAALLLQETTDEPFRIEAWEGFHKLKSSSIQFGPDTPLVRHLSAHPLPTFLDQLECTLSLKFLDRSNWAALNRLQVELVVPLSSRNAQMGFLLLGPRKWEPGYCREDEALLVTVGNQLASIIDTARLYQELASARSRLDQNESLSLRALERRISCIAHDFNNVLTVILLRAELLGMAGDVEVKEHAAVIRQMALDATASVQRMSEPARLLEPSDSQPVKVNDLVMTALQIVETYRRGNGMDGAAGWDVKVELGEEGVVMGNAAELREALSNILLNAMESLPSHQGRIKISSAKIGASALITVWDNGSGVPEDIKEHIFEPFVTTKGNHGRGLGLGVTQEIVSYHGGRIEMESEIGRGSNFTIYLPLLNKVAEENLERGQEAALSSVATAVAEPIAQHTGINAC